MNNLGSTLAPGWPNTKASANTYANAASNAAMRGQREYTKALTVAGSEVHPLQEKGVETTRDVEKPLMFKGEPEKWPEWIAKMELKLRATKFRTVIDGLQYVQQFLEGPPFHLTAARIPSTYGRPCSKPYLDVDAMLKHLQERYALANTYTKAFANMTNLKQATGEKFSDFYIKYQQYASYMDLTDQQEVQMLITKLNARYLRTVADGSTYATIQDLTDRCTRLETSLETLDAVHPRANTNDTIKAKGRETKGSEGDKSRASGSSQ
jgi:hypothetical protein